MSVAPLFYHVDNRVSWYSTRGGSSGKMVRLGDITEQLFDTAFGLNVRGTLFTVQKARPLLADGASIILNESVAGRKGFPAHSVYSTSKAAPRAFARGWLVDYKGRHIRVNLLITSTIYTAAMAAVAPEIRAYVKSLIPRDELGRPEEMASAVLFLASSDASFVNGVELAVDGGAGQI